MAFIQNVCFWAIEDGQHATPGEGAILIQLWGQLGDFPKPKYTGFSEVYQFRMEDIVLDEEWGPRPEQGITIANILSRALRENKDIIVHCHAGISRSGAVAEAAVALGFESKIKYAMPNWRLKKYIMDSLGLPYNPHDDVRRERE